MPVSVVLHAHFYQPPRENPWTGIIEEESNAAPDHDWNARINRECYAPLASIPIGPSGEERPRLNAYEWLNFDVGPTLFEWLEVEAPLTYRAILAGDAAGRRRLGHGNAIAMPYHHVILPLSSRRDKTSEVRWGLADFRRRYGRDAEGMWLPETAVDDETLDVLAAEGVAFTVLAPHQIDIKVPVGLPVRLRTSGGRTIAAFVYDGQLSHGVAFGNLLQDSNAWESATLPGDGRRVSSLATDGETFGHHHKFADLSLGALLYRVARRPDAQVANYASLLAAYPPMREAELVSPSSWSCPHGVERWRSSCGCHVAEKTQQGWRAPLRKAIDWLVQEVNALYERGARESSLDPWRTRDNAPVWHRVMSNEPRTNRLLDMDRSALRAQTSCGWFFDDFGGLEGRQVLRYAARAISLAGGDAARLEAGFMERLEGAESNDPKVGTARDWYRTRIRQENRPT